MEALLKQLHNILNTAYILFAFILGLWATVTAARNRPFLPPAEAADSGSANDSDDDSEATQDEPGILGGQFLGAMAVHTVLAGITLGLAGLMALFGIPAARWVYYLYGMFFVIVLPGTFTLMRGRDDRRAALIYAAVVVFAGLSAFRTPELTGW